MKEKGIPNENYSITFVTLGTTLTLYSTAPCFPAVINLPMTAGGPKPQEFALQNIDYILMKILTCKDIIKEKIEIYKILDHIFVIKRSPNIS